MNFTNRSILAALFLFTVVNPCFSQGERLESKASKADFEEVRSLLLKFEDAYNNKNINSVIGCLSKSTLNYVSLKDQFISPFRDYKNFYFIFDLDNLELSRSYILNKYNLSCIIKVRIEYLFYSGDFLSFLSYVKFVFTKDNDVWKIETINFSAPSLDKEPFEFYIHQACKNFQDKKYNLMEEDLNKAIELNPKSSLANFLLGVGVYYAQYYTQKDLFRSIRARKYFKKAIELLSENNPPIFRLGDNYYKAALYYYMALIQYQAKKISDEQYTEKFYKAIIEDVKKALDFNPSHTMAISFLSYVYSLIDEVKNANEARYELFKNTRGSPELFYNFYIYDLSKYKHLDLIYDFFRLSDYSQESIDKFKKILEKDSEFTPAYYYLGKVYFLKNDLSESEKYLKEVINRDPSNDDAFFTLATIYQLNKKIDLAIEYYNNSLGLNPYSVRLYLNLADLYYIKDNLSEAVVYAKKFIEYYPYDYKGWFMLSDIYLKQTDKNNEALNEALNVTAEALKLCTDQRDMMVLSYRLDYLSYKMTNK